MSEKVKSERISKSSHEEDMRSLNEKVQNLEEQIKGILK